MKTSLKIALTLLLAFITMIPGPVLYKLYLIAGENLEGFSLSLFEQRGNVAVIVATFAFTMLGFLAAVITILFSFTKTSAFLKYSNRGYLSVFFGFYYITIFSLVLTFGSAILTLSGNNSEWPMRIALMLTVNCVTQIAVLTIILVNLGRRALSKCS